MLEKVIGITWTIWNQIKCYIFKNNISNPVFMLESATRTCHYTMLYNKVTNTFVQGDDIGPKRGNNKNQLIEYYWIPPPQRMHK